MLKDQGSDDVRQELLKSREREKLAQQKVHELQHTLLDVEGKLGGMKDQTKSAASLVRCSTDYIVKRAETFANCLIRPEQGSTLFFH